MVAFSASKLSAPAIAVIKLDYVDDLLAEARDNFQIRPSVAAPEATAASEIRLEFCHRIPMSSTETATDSRCGGDRLNV